MENVYKSRSLEWQTTAGAAKTPPPPSPPHPVSSFPRLFLSGRRQWCGPTEPTPPSSTPPVQLPARSHVDSVSSSGKAAVQAGQQWGRGSPLAAWLQDNQQNGTLE